MKEKARELRKNQTDAEKLLWHHLRNRRMAGYKFRRQHSIPPYIVDFVCIDKKLILEIDGGQHSLNKEEDNKRTAYLESKGFKVFRFWNNQVSNETESVLEVIKSMLESAPKVLNK